MKLSEKIKHSLKKLETTEKPSFPEIISKFSCGLTKKLQVCVPPIKLQGEIPQIKILH